MSSCAHGGLGNFADSQQGICFLLDVQMVFVLGYLGKGVNNSVAANMAGCDEGGNRAIQMHLARVR